MALYKITMKDGAVSIVPIISIEVVITSHGFSFYDAMTNRFKYGPEHVARVEVVSERDVMESFNDWQTSNVKER